MKTPYLLPSFIFVFLFLNIFLSSIAMANSLQFYPSDDAYFNSNAPTTNYGNNSLVSITSASFYNQSGYFKFNLTGIPNNSVINSAIFHTDQQTASGGTFNFLLYNTTLNWTEENLTYTNRTPLSQLITNVSIVVTGGHMTFYDWNLTQLIQDAVTAGKDAAVVIRYNNVSMTPTVVVALRSKEGFPHSQYINITFTTNNDCNTSILGSYCDPVQLAAGLEPTIVVTTPDYSCLNDLHYECALGSYCSQITPQINITTPITGSASLCSLCRFLVMPWETIGSFNCPKSAGFSGKCLSTNCPNNPECECSGKNCGSAMYGTTNITNVSISMTDFTAGCFNPITGSYDIVIQANGTNTSITNLSAQIFQNATLIVNNYSYVNTSTSCYDAYGNFVTCSNPNAQETTACTDYGSQLALGFGYLFGVSNCGVSRIMTSIIISLIIAIIGAIALSYYAGVEGALIGQIFIITMLAMIIMFTMISWFPSWLLIILLILAGLLVSKTLGVGG